MADDKNNKGKIGFFSPRAKPRSADTGFKHPQEKINPRSNEVKDVDKGRPDSSKTSGLDTGTPGFDIDGQTYTFDTVEKGDSGIDPVATTRGDMNVSYVVKDISKSTIETIGSYLGKSTSTNRYPVDETSKSVSLTTNKGSPTALGDTENVNKFTDRASILDNVSLSFDPREELVGKVSKGKTDPQLIDGNDVLRSAEQGASLLFLDGSVSKNGNNASNVQRYVSAVLKNNRFTEAAKSSPNDVTDPGSKYDPTLRSPTYGDASMMRLAQIGPSLSIRSSAELNSTEAGNNPTDGGTEAGALLPGFSQLAVKKVSTRLLRARDVLEDLTKEEVPEELLVSISDKSWGNLNNVHDQFSGFQALGMIGLSIALTAAVVVSFESLSVVVGLVNPSPPQRKDINGRYFLGNAHLEKGSKIPGLPSGGGVGTTLLGIRPTVRPLNEAIKKGVEIFFGFDSSNGAITSGLTQSISSPGYNVVVARTIIRSSIAVIESFKKAFSNTTNVVSGIKNVLNIVESIKKSKFIAAINVFAQLGDAALTDSEDEVIPGANGEPLKKSKIDSLADDVPGFAVMKNRFRDGRLKLAWANNTSPSLYLLPTRILGATLSTKMGAHHTGYGLQEEKSRSKYKLIQNSDKSPKSNRIPYEGKNADDPGVEAMEAALEAEYMPFYFHDLRTNEIISFHAFISTLTESFAPGYESVEGFGRVDHVMIYKNTKRTINFKFHIVATGEDDFNDMWVKINKLITLVYPQYTQGRTVATTDYEFIQPFSQMMGASPVIRLRLGDLIRSNYSRFALARLFGVGTKEQLKLNGQVVDFDIQSGLVKEEIQKLKKEKQGKWQIATDGISMDASSLDLPTFGPTGASFHPSVFSAGGDAQYLPVTIEKFIDNDETAIVVPSIISTSDLTNYYGMDPQSATSLVNRLKQTYDNRNNTKTYVVGGRYIVPIWALRVTPMLSNHIDVNRAGSVTTPAALDALNAFMNDENALVKSFNNIKGKGLPGVITNMEFDWMDKVLWGTDPGSRAPKMCTVTMTYAPIHDISPGLDHVGYNRAPVYPVGWFANGIDEKKG